jgi:hypothetical protein
MHLLRWGHRSKGDDHLAGPNRAFVAVSATILSIFAAQVVASPQRAASDAVPTEQTISECNQQYSALKNELEEKAEPIRKAKQQRVAADELCQAIKGYEEAELKIIGFVIANSKRCGFSPRISQDLTSVYKTTVTLKEKACASSRRPLRFG